MGWASCRPRSCAGSFPARTSGHAAQLQPRGRRVAPLRVRTIRARSRRCSTRTRAPCPTSRGAVRRQLEELPSTRNGLSRTEHQALAAIAAGAGDVARRFARRRRWRSASSWATCRFARAVRGLADAELPLVRLDPAGPVRRARAAGGDADAVRPRGPRRPRGSRPRNGMDRWVGGVWLQGETSRGDGTSKRGRSTGRLDPWSVIRGPLPVMPFNSHARQSAKA